HLVTPGGPDLPVHLLVEVPLLLERPGQQWGPHLPGVLPTLLEEHAGLIDDYVNGPPIGLTHDVRQGVTFLFVVPVMASCPLIRRSGAAGRGVPHYSFCPDGRL